MSIYRIADVNIDYSPQSDYMRAFLSDYHSDGKVHLTVSLSRRDINAEAPHLPCPHEGVQEAAALMRAVGERLPAFDRLLLHAATVTLDGKAYAFIAPSGTGKTTHSQLWVNHLAGRARILNGDKLIVHVGGHTATAFDSPWRGKEHLGYVGSAPLAGLFVLTRGDTATCKPISPLSVLPELLRATPFSAPKDGRLQVLTLLEQLVTLVPSFHLQAPATVEAVEAVLDAIGGSQ